MARKKRSTKADLLADQAIALAEYAAKALIAAEQLRIKTKAVEQFSLAEDEQATVALLPALPAKVKKKLKADGLFTVAEVAIVVLAVAESFVDAQAKRQADLLLIANKLMDCLQTNIVMADPRARAKTASDAGIVYQVKITLLGIKPAIWRRIQAKDCALDKLHEHIQTAMGWTNSHLHRFQIGEERYADPLLMEEDMEEMSYKDSTTTMLSDFITKTSKRLRFLYEYDFGDGWDHEVLFEGCPKAETGQQYPLCLEGARACPPEDCGGVGGYAAFLEAIRDKNHEEREEMFEWVSGWFDPEEFDPVTATKSMKKGLPDWRNEESI